MKILNMAITFGDMSDLTSSERDFSRSGDVTNLKPESKKEFLSLVKKANYIAIDSDYLLRVTENKLETNALTQQIDLTDYDMANLPICPPFKSQWIELSHSGPKSMAPSINFNGHIVTILGMLVNEISPNLYNIYTFESHAKIGCDPVHKLSLSRNVSGSNSNSSNLQMCFAVWMKAINTGSLGIEDGEDVVMLPKENGKKEGKKKPHQIRRIVRIVPKNSKLKTEPIMNKGKIDFSHRWEVRGHWRRVAGMGKDREGNYEIRGLTWVKDCVKGPEELPIIQKLRWVPGQAS